ncbi:MAG: hypothetical protein ACXVAX_08840 [Pseudobdellovibrio sp.]
MKLKFLLLGLFLILNFSCGIKGPPLPPIETVGDSKLNSAAQQVSGTQVVSGDNSKRDLIK